MCVCGGRGDKSVCARAHEKERECVYDKLCVREQDAMELPDRYFDVMTNFTTLLEELDVMDDLTGGGGMRGQTKLRKMFLQPLRMLQSAHTHQTRTGKVRMQKSPAKEPRDTQRDLLTCTQGAHVWRPS